MCIQDLKEKDCERIAKQARALFVINAKVAEQLL
jgi:hypothetical protein